MRHIGSLLAGLLIAPIAWVLAGAATVGLNTSVYENAAGAPNKPVAMAMLAVAGLLLGLTAVTRLSPAGPLAIAAVFGGGFLLVRVMGADLSLPSALHSAKIPSESVEAAGSNPLTLAVAALFFTALLIPSRWRGKDEDEDRVADVNSLSDQGKDQAAFPPPAFGDSNSAFGGAPVNPFDTGQTQPQQPQQQVPGEAEPQRSAYADDRYGREDDPFDGYNAGGQQSPGQAGGYPGQQPSSGFYR